MLIILSAAKSLIYAVEVPQFELLVMMCRRQFDLAHREAVDESAEWRSRFDEERERATECMMELNAVCYIS